MLKKVNKVIFISNNKEYGAKEITLAFKQAGIKEGDSVFIHSDLKYFGKVNPAIARNEFLEAFFKALLSVVTEKGNIIMPAFSYSFCKEEIFDPATTPSTVGILTEYFRTQRGVQRSIDPIFSVSALGPDKEYFIDVGQDCFGKKSIFEKLYDKNVKIVFMGERFDMTFVHFIEQKYGVPHRFIKKFKGKIRLGGKLKEFVFDYNVRPLDQDISLDLEGLAHFLENRNVLKKSQLGHSKIRVVAAVDAFNEITKAFSRKEYFLIKNTHSNDPGQQMYALIKELFPICRSITGNGVRKTLQIIGEHIPVKVYEVPTGTKVFDWVVPKEWNIRDAYVMDDLGQKIVDFKKNNLHLVGYSVPVNTTVTLSQLQEHLYSLPDQPEAVPYVTSYYEERWGFCIAHKDRKKLKDIKYRVCIDSELKEGALTYGELIIQGESDKEVFLSTYICHPSLANNELSGPSVTTFLAKWLLSKPRRYSYRVIFIPETIGSIAYLSKNLKVMKKNIIAGFNITCVGDDRAYSYLPSRNGHTYADKAALNVLSFKHPDFIKWSFLDRGSDERQYNSPGVDLPVCSVMRSKYGAYPQYHTSLDNPAFISPQGLTGSYDTLKECLMLIEENHKYKINCLGEPQLAKRGLYPTISTITSANEVKHMMDFIAYADGENDLIAVSNKINVPVRELYPIIEKLMKADLLTAVDL